MYSLTDYIASKILFINYWKSPSKGKLEILAEEVAARGMDHVDLAPVEFG